MKTYNYVRVQLSCENVTRSYLVSVKEFTEEHAKNYHTILKNLIKDNYTVSVKCIGDDDDYVYNTEGIYHNPFYAAVKLKDVRLHKIVKDTIVEIKNEHIVKKFKFNPLYWNINIDHSNVEFINIECILDYASFDKFDFKNKLIDLGFDADIALSGIIYVRKAEAELDDNGNLVISCNKITRIEKEIKKEVEL